MSTLKVYLKKKIDNSYPIVIKKGIFEQIPEDLVKRKFGNRYCIITDSKVKKLYGNKLLKNLQKARIKAGIISFPHGENSKSWEMAEKIGTKMIELGMNRHDCVIALGGGTTGDLAGFVSSVFMRGIPFIQIPTTLLSMVDSSIGGKTGVNLRIAKNMLGTFHQPKKVYIDTTLLETLPIKEMRNGLAEVIKCGAIQSKRLFRILEKKVDKILQFDHKALNRIIKSACIIKKEVIEDDETEKGWRMILNYGHTYGHALEKASHYQIPHGEAVAIGICLENEIALRKVILKKKDALRIKNLLEKAGLPVQKPKNITMRRLKEIIKYDKKAVGGKIKLVVPDKIGRVRMIDI